MVRVKVCTILHLVKALGGREVEMQVPAGSTVGQLLKELAVSGAGGNSEVLFSDPHGRLNPDILVMVNGRQLPFLQGLETVLSDDDEVLLLPAVAGG